MSLKLEYHLLFIFVLTLTYKECLKLVKERLKQPYHERTLKTGLKELQLHIKSLTLYYQERI